MCIIMEYAAHGSLKDFLKTCKETVLTLNHQPAVIGKGFHETSGSSNHMVGTCNTANVDMTLCCDQGDQTSTSLNARRRPLLIKQDSGFSGSVDMASPSLHTHTTTSLTMDYTNCRGLIHMEDVQNFVLQIASGLRHLEAMEVNP